MKCALRTSTSFSTCLIVKYINQNKGIEGFCNIPLLFHKPCEQNSLHRFVGSMMGQRWYVGSHILGVPQGSVLGPILFLIYDLPDAIKSKVRLFADGMAIYLADSSLEDAQILQQNLDHLYEWELEWDIEFNSSKCVIIHITRS